jgi:hypothetical protein
MYWSRPTAAANLDGLAVVQVARARRESVEQHPVGRRS